jgi:hypothetical protein
MYNQDGLLNKYIFLSISGIINSIFKFCVIGIIIVPYFLKIEQDSQINTVTVSTKVYIIQLISSIGICLCALSDICTCFTLAETKQKNDTSSSIGCFPSCLLFLIFSTPSVTVFWLSHLVNNGEINDNGISLWIILTFFSTMFFNLCCGFIYYLIVCFFNCFHKKETRHTTFPLSVNKSSVEIVLV